jgi:hypothetical protein
LHIDLRQSLVSPNHHHLCIKESGLMRCRELNDFIVIKG